MSRLRGRKVGARNHHDPTGSRKSINVQGAVLAPTHLLRNAPRPPAFTQTWRSIASASVRTLTIAFVLLAALSLLSSPALADRDSKRRSKNEPSEQRERKSYKDHKSESRSGNSSAKERTSYKDNFKGTDGGSRPDRYRDDTDTGESCDGSDVFLVRRVVDCRVCGHWYCTCYYYADPYTGVEDDTFLSAGYLLSAVNLTVILADKRNSFTAASGIVIGGVNLLLAAVDKSDLRYSHAWLGAASIALGVLAFSGR